MDPNGYAPSGFEFFLYELPEDGTDVPKHAAVVKDRTFRYVCILCIDSFFLDERPAKRTG